ncbi:MAG TPA: hypothetical protein V6D27_17640 [Vampirovibrionales bacterium]
MKSWKSEPIAPYSPLLTPLCTPVPITAISHDKTTSGLYPTGWMLIKRVNCIEFDSKKDVFAIALRRLRLEWKQRSPKNELGWGRPEKSSDGH